jgi:hypothetical protein
LKFAAILSSLIAVNPIWWCLTLSNGRLKRYPTMPSHIYSAADIATRKNWQTEPGLFLGKSKVAGGARKQFVNTFTIASTLDITTPEMIAPRGKDMRSASAFAAISPISLSRFVGA